MNETAQGQTVGSYFQVNGLNMYYEIHGTGQPLVLLHGGLGSTGMFGENFSQLAEGRQVIAADLQGHGRTADIDRPIRFELMAEDIAALLEHLGVGRADVMGYSLGGGVALRTAIQHPELVRKLVLVSTPFKRDAWYPEVRESMAQMGAPAAKFMQGSPIYQSYVSIAPRPDDFPLLLDKVGDLLRQPYDYTDGVAGLTMPTMIVFADHDSFSPAHAVEFFELLGGGQRDAGWDGAGMSNARLAILPGATHYNSFYSPALAPAVTAFLDAPMPDDQ